MNADFGQRFEGQVLPRISTSFVTLMTAVEGRAAALSGARATELEDEFAARLYSLERRNAAADTQLAELRAACTETYRRFSEVNERLDQIWFDDNTEGLGGWRETVQKLNLEKAANDKTPLEAFRRDSAMGEDEAEATAATGITCPMCGERSGRRKPRTGMKDDLLGMAGIAPFWCSRCMVRFYRFQTAKRRKA
jgi:hypothetical protein